MKLRLLLFEECNRKCRGCCNKDWDLVNLPICDNYMGYDQILLTGGEPLLHPFIVAKAVAEIRQQTDTLIYLYTAKVDELTTLSNILSIVDGITVTLHTNRDVIPFLLFNSGLRLIERLTKGKSLRLNIFHNVVHPTMPLPLWNVKRNIIWDKNCPLPEDEVFMKYNGGE